MVHSTIYSQYQNTIHMVHSTIYSQYQNTIHVVHIADILCQLLPSFVPVSRRIKYLQFYLWMYNFVLLPVTFHYSSWKAAADVWHALAKQSVLFVTPKYSKNLWFFILFEVLLVKLPCTFVPYVLSLTLLNAFKNHFPVNTSPIYCNRPITLLFIGTFPRVFIYKYTACTVVVTVVTVVTVVRLVIVSPYCPAVRLVESEVQ